MMFFFNIKNCIQPCVLVKKIFLEHKLVTDIYIKDEFIFKSYWIEKSAILFNTKRTGGHHHFDA